jgi:DNA-binding GntR family transcriptional regulator
MRVSSSPKPLPLLPRASLADTTADLLRQKILSGDYAPGTRLIEAEVARQLGISRAPVREALSALQAEGLTTESPGRGTFVRTLSPDEIREIYDLRATLESGAIRLILERDDPGRVAVLQAAIVALEEARKANDRDAFVEADLRLHEELCRASGNRRLVDAWSSQVSLLRALFRLELDHLAEDMKVTYQSHSDLVAAIVRGDADEATEVCWRLFREAAEALGSLLGTRQNPYL